MPIELCITYPEMLVIAQTKLGFVSGPLMPLNIDHVQTPFQ